MSDEQPRRSSSDLVACETRSPGFDDDGRELLEHALASFQSTLSDEERLKLQRMKGSPCDTGSIIQFTHELDGIDASRRGRSLATTLHSLLHSVEQFYQITNTYVSSHPEIAALVWGSVKLAFMVLGNFTSYFQKFSELLRGFDQLVPRFAEYRRLFPVSTRLRRATYEFQTAIVRCCSQVVLVTRRPWQKQLITALSQSFQTEMDPLVDDIRIRAKCVKEEIELAKTQAEYDEQVLQSQERHQAGESRREVLRWFAKSDKEMQGLRQEEQVRARERKWGTLIERLSQYDFAAAFKSARGKRHNGTAEWVFRTTEFDSWYAHPTSSLLHLEGKIGSGKTVLTANVVNHLIQLREQNSQLVAFFFVRFDDPPSQQFECIIRSVIRQLLGNGSSEIELLRLLELSSDQFFETDSLITLWSERVRSFKDFFLVLDGFDECTLANRKEILKCLSKLSEACKPTTRVKILLSSRSSVREEVDQLDVTVIRMTVNARNISEDLTKYAEEILKNRISTRELTLQDQSLFNAILRAVSFGGEGMFLWVFLTIEDICSQTSDSEIRRSLKSIPKKLSETFDRALQRITNNGKADIAQTIFNWTATVRVPLTLNQLKESLAVNIGQSHSEPERYPNQIARLTAWCENLVHVEETDETVRFSHHSIREYLLRDAKTFRVNQRVWNHHVGEICLTYLEFNDFKKTLFKRSEPMLANVANYPAGVTTATIQNLVPGFRNYTVLTFVQKWFQSPNNHTIVHKPRVPAQGASDSVTGLGYPFFEYASDQWLFHTTDFRPEITRTWNLWETIIRTKLPTWIDLNWDSKDYISATEHCLLTANQPDPQHFRDHFVPWHKAILLAELTGHDTLMDHAFSVLQQYGSHLSPRLLRALMITKHIVVGLHSPLSFTLQDQDIHAIVVHIFSRYIAVIGSFEIIGAVTGEKCYLEPEEAHSDGINQDVCTMLCTGRPISNHRSAIQLLAQLSVSELDNDARETINKALMDDRTTGLLRTRTSQGKTIANLVIERDERWWLAIADGIADQRELSPSYSSMMRDSLKFALAAHDEHSACLLLQGKDVDWTENGTMDYRAVWYAVRFKLMSSALRAKFIDLVIHRRSTHASTEEAKGGLQGVTLPTMPPSVPSEAQLPQACEVGHFPEPWKMCDAVYTIDDSDKEGHSYGDQKDHILCDAVYSSSWEIAVALYVNGARLATNESGRLAVEAFHDVLGCICRLEWKWDEACYLSKDDDEGAVIVLCQEHNKRPPGWSEGGRSRLG